MKKKCIVIVSILLIVFFIIGITLFFCDNVRVKFSYEYVNYVEYSNGKTIKVSIPWDNRIHYLSENELMEFLEKGTGVLYFGYNTCPWCRNSFPILIDTVRKNNIDVIYYADIHKLDFSSIREKIVSILDSYLEEDGEGKKVIAVPDVYVLKDGKILGNHRGTVDSYHNPYNGMSDVQKEELASIYQKLIEEMKK